MSERIALVALAAATAVLAVVASASLAYSVAQANAVSEMRETCSVCRDSLLQCTARREQMESLLEIAASSRRARAIGGGP